APDIPLGSHIPFDQRAPAAPAFDFGEHLLGLLTRGEILHPGEATAVGQADNELPAQPFGGPGHHGDLGPRIGAAGLGVRDRCSGRGAPRRLHAGAIHSEVTDANRASGRAPGFLIVTRHIRIWGHSSAMSRQALSAKVSISWNFSLRIHSSNREAMRV